MSRNELIVALTLSGFLIAVPFAVVFVPQPVVNQGIADQVESALPVTVHVYKEGVCQGSGCIITENGVVFTAKHVTDGEYGKYQVTLNDGRTFTVKAVLEDKGHDVAFLQLEMPEGTKLPYAKLADVSELRVGDPLFIVGSPFGRDNFNSVSLGILSAAQRNLDDPIPYPYGWTVTFQSDATAEPGNSGGPVFNLKGEVIGVLVAGMDATVNYSVPVNVFRNKLDVIVRMFEELDFSPVEKQEVIEDYYDGYYVPGGDY